MVRPAFKQGVYVKLKATMIHLSFTFILLFLFPGCFLLINTDDIVNAEYYGPNSFRLGYIGMWEDDDFEGIYVYNDTGTTYIITKTKQVGWATSYSTNYEILYVYPDWIPGELITVSYAGKKHSFRVPKEEP
jgi:hypothetical protein